MESKLERRAGIPGEALSFEVSLEPSDAEDEVRWSGGGAPATGPGRRFTTSFDTGGTYTVTASCGSASLAFDVEICPLDAWLADAREYYGDSIDFARVRITTSRLVIGDSGTAWTCNNVVRFKRPSRAGELHESTLIHELGHVWEHQTGQMQLLAGLVEQIGRRVFGKDPYDYGGPDGVAAARELPTFKKEGQAQILTEYWKARHGHHEDRRKVSFSTPGYVENLERLVEGSGIGSMSPRRRGPGSVIDAFVARIVNGVLGAFE